MEKETEKEQDTVESGTEKENKQKRMIYKERDRENEENETTTNKPEGGEKHNRDREILRSPQSLAIIIYFVPRSHSIDPPSVELSRT